MKALLPTGWWLLARGFGSRLQRHAHDVRIWRRAGCTDAAADLQTPSALGFALVLVGVRHIASIEVGLLLDIPRRETTCGRRGSSRGLLNVVEVEVLGIIRPADIVVMVVQ